MPFQPVVNCAKVLLNWLSAQGNHAMNIIWIVDSTGPYTLARLGDMLAIISAWATAEWKPASSDSWELDTIVATDWSEENSITDLVVPSVVGDVASENLAGFNTIAISLRTPFAGRSFRGRLYHVGLAEGQVNGEFLEPTAGPILIGVYEQLRLDLIADNFQWVIASFVSEGVRRAEGVATPVTDIYLTDIALDTMRSRKVA